MTQRSTRRKRKLPVRQVVLCAVVWRLRKSLIVEASSVEELHRLLGLPNRIAPSTLRKCLRGLSAHGELSVLFVADSGAVVITHPRSYLLIVLRSLRMYVRRTQASGVVFVELTTLRKVLGLRDVRLLDLREMLEALHRLEKIEISTLGNGRRWIAVTS